MTTSKHPTSQIKNSTNPELQTMNNPTQTYNQNLQKLTHPNPPNFIIARTIPAIKINTKRTQDSKIYFQEVRIKNNEYSEFTNKYNHEPSIFNLLTSFFRFGGIPPPKLWQGTG